MEIQGKLAPEIAFDKQAFERFIYQKHKLSPEDTVIRMEKRSVDARRKPVTVLVKASIHKKGEVPDRISYRRDYPNVATADPVIIVGAGPAGMFAALRLIELGLKPIIFERGKDVKSRTKDIADISRRHIVHSDSNFCFGEGGAGTFSDGKLYTRSKKRGDWQRILEIFTVHGADENIMIDSHPHIGTNKLPRIVAEIRKSILDAGGEIHFNTTVTDFILKNDEMKGVVLKNGNRAEGLGVILATGHSARDIFELLYRRKIDIEFKPFALGVRAEHAQQFIDRIQYNRRERGQFLPAAPYALVAQANFEGKRKGVFSFCMCPGGFIVPSATEAGEVVVNGMSPSRRNSKYANSGIVVSVDDEDIQAYKKFGPLAGLRYQQDVERNACKLAGGTQAAPAQRIADFVQRKQSSGLLQTSYQPGLQSVVMDEVLPKPIAARLRQGFQMFDKKMRGYLTNEAQIIGVESRTSSPVRIPRDRESFEHTRIKRLYPCAEGAGYAGGIASAAIDGERCAEKLAAKYGKS